ncbi:M6 family metalloprotease domain-containing protein [Myxococcus sp. RHSTA-1-4]|uniref:M6 family metalloprotease domain-containing protein n=1 Tax=Myxococcus sp. RHSTA-1-4 TaxID=2874601 RepID=UPI001CBF6BA0|nr:M6 family metalloprotease domain-containing protein [Myxococcus sp. RHSTA-1-4]MBZ4416189.1 M6 family metalloprotease domain-containing protein [Myxococcus sp. RHSTA-1-4]
MPDGGTVVQPQRWSEQGFEFTHALKPLVRQVQHNRQQAVARFQTTAPGGSSLAAAGHLKGPLRIQGTRRILVLPLLFKNSGPAPFAPERLQQELFGSWPSGTLTDYFREVSYGAFTLTGQVAQWRTVSREDTWYEGEDFEEEGELKTCNGLCAGGRSHELLKEALALYPEIDWRQYDNDGPDGVPDSGDDNGIADFVAFMHPEMGGECYGLTPNLWSHRGSLRKSPGGMAFETSTPRRGGKGNILVDDYVVVPGLACDGNTMVQIGVFAHEVGHALGLPDLYDTDDSKNGQAGLGTWCLMAAGSWGADRSSPHRPVHLSPWAKDYLGWLDLEWLSRPEQTVTLPAIEHHRKAYAVAVPGNESEHYILVNSLQAGFDSDLPASGLQVWHVRQQPLREGLELNRVNIRPDAKGIDLVEADGYEGLDALGATASEGDLFPGSANARRFDSTTRPAARGTLGICDISNAGPTMTLRVVRGSGCAPAGQDESASRTPSAP